MYLSKQHILAAQDLPREAVPVPEWGGTVLVRTLTGAERDDFEIELGRSRGADRQANLKNMRARMAILTVIDGEGQPVFSAADADKLGGKSAAALERIFEVAMRLNRWSKEDIDELTKKSAATTGSASPSDSPSPSAAPAASSSPASTPPS